jgi:hypothetical protein
MKNLGSVAIGAATAVIIIVLVISWYLAGITR